MCAICGCSDHDPPPAHEGHGHTHAGHSHAHSHSHDGVRAHVELRAGRARARSITVLERDVLAKNDRLARENRLWLAERSIFALNLVSSPGAGKTTLLERAIRDLGKELSIHVIEGDQATDRDAQRIRRAGARAVQVNTGAGCHLDAAMVARALEDLAPPKGALLVIENVGNLVCPALFDLGEHHKVVIASVTEGEDKPAKYPHMFRAGGIVLLNKVDLLPHVEFDVGRFTGHMASVNPASRLFQVSATRGDGLAAFHDWLREQTLRGEAT
ncbi:MAG TPA: hydrogenase nickel incorporation protein HypB [Polyangiaceae bacterium]|nr:hydrogenase nickel incorporation protein HypB [Polyangiaceae bacterium]